MIAMYEICYVMAFMLVFFALLEKIVPALAMRTHTSSVRGVREASRPNAGTQRGGRVVEKDESKRVEFGRNVSAEHAKKHGFVIKIPMDFKLDEYDPAVEVRVVVKPQDEEE